MIEVYTVLPVQYELEETAIISESCECRDKILTKTKLSNGAIQYRLQCINCGGAGTAIAYSALTQEEKDECPDFDYEIKKRFYARIRELKEEQQREREGIYNLNTQLWWEWFNDYLNSGCWHRKRSAVMKRASGICEACGKNRATQVHHLTYDRVGREPLFDLVAVCKECHEQLTEFSRGR